jgi:hypothetical protein
VFRVEGSLSLPLRADTRQRLGQGEVPQADRLAGTWLRKCGRAIEADHLATRAEAVSDVFTMAVMLTGRLLAESLRVGTDLEVADLRVVRIGRHDVSHSTTPSDGSDPADDNPRGAVAGQPPIWTFLDFEAPDDRADDLAQALAAALEIETGWWADLVVGGDHVVVFARRIFRYRIGDTRARAEAVAWGRASGTPEHQLDWGD